MGCKSRVKTLLAVRHSSPPMRLIFVIRIPHACLLVVRHPFPPRRLIYVIRIPHSCLLTVRYSSPPRRLFYIIRIQHACLLMTRYSSPPRRLIYVIRIQHACLLMARYLSPPRRPQPHRPLEIIYAEHLINMTTSPHCLPEPNGSSLESYMALGRGVEIVRSKYLIFTPPPMSG